MKLKLIVMMGIGFFLNSSYGAAQQSNENSFATESTEHIIDNLGFVLEARGVYAIANGLQGLPVAKINDVLTRIIQEENSPLTIDDKIELWLVTAFLQAGMQDDQNTILNLYGDLELLRRGAPVLFVAAHTKNSSQIISMLLQWIQYIQKNPAIMPQAINKAITEIPIKASSFAIAQNNVKAMSTLFSNGITLSRDQTTNLLWLVVEGNKKSGFIGLLVKHGADINAERKGYSPLMKAVENNNRLLTHAIVKAGADVHALYKPEVGTALQIAIEKGYVPIDEYLRSHGAREVRKTK